METGRFKPPKSVLSMKLNSTKVSIALLTAILMLAATMAATVFTSNVNAQTASSLSIDNGAAYTNSSALTLALSSSGAVQMRFSIDNSSWSDWESYATSRNYTLTEGDGNYTIYVEFQDGDSNSAYANASIVLDTTPPEPVPYADWYSADYRTVYFDASYSTDNFGIQNATWNFGDGNVTSGVTVIHTYAAAGNYTASLTVQDYAGNAVNVTFPINIPNLNAIATPTPTPAPTIPPTTYPTSTPTASPTPPPTGLDSTWTLAIIAVAVIVIVGVVIIVALRPRSKPVPTAP
jgi:PKD repeat protein